MSGEARAKDEPDTHLLIQNKTGNGYKKYKFRVYGSCFEETRYWGVVQFYDYSCCLAVLMQALRLGAFPLNPIRKPCKILNGESYEESGDVRTSFLPSSRSIHAHGNL